MRTIFNNLAQFDRQPAIDIHTKNNHKYQIELN